MTEWADREMGEEGTELEGKASSWVKFAKKIFKASATDKTCHLLSWEQDNYMKMLFHLVLEPQRSKSDKIPATLVGCDVK